MWVLAVLLALGAIFVAFGIRVNQKEAQKENEKRAAMSPLELQAYVQKAAIAGINQRAQEEGRRQARATADFNWAEQNRLAQVTSHYGQLNTMMVCPHCNNRGQIRTRRVTNKRGVSGGKATAAASRLGSRCLRVDSREKSKGLRHGAEPVAISGVFSNELSN
jgi:hypothetical protein